MLFNKAYIDYNSVILYLHLPKSGGSSVRENLKKYFQKDQFIRITENNLNHYLDNEITSFNKLNSSSLLLKLIKKFNLASGILKFTSHFKKTSKNFDSLTLEEKQKLRFISSNQERDCVTPILGKHYLKLMVIRDPISRIQSYFYYAKKAKGKKPYILAAKKYDIDDFIKYLYDNRPIMLKNPYSVCISGTEDFLISKKVIDTEFFLVAPTERINDFLKVLIFKFFSKIEKFEKFNVNIDNPVKSTISDELTEKILSDNQVDINLKKHIEIEFDSIFKNFKF